MLATTLLIRVVRNIDFWRGNYRDKDMPRYDLSIAIFDTIRYIVPSLNAEDEDDNLHYFSSAELSQFDNLSHDITFQINKKINRLFNS